MLQLELPLIIDQLNPLSPNYKPSREAEHRGHGTFGFTVNIPKDNPTSWKE